MKKNCREISKDKIAVCEKTAGLRSGNSSDLDSACLKALVPVEIFHAVLRHALRKSFSRHFSRAQHTAYSLYWFTLFSLMTF